MSALILSFTAGATISFRYNADKTVVPDKDLYPADTPPIHDPDGNTGVPYHTNYILPMFV